MRDAHKLISMHVLPLSTSYSDTNALQIDIFFAEAPRAHRLPHQPQQTDSSVALPSKHSEQAATGTKYT